MRGKFGILVTSLGSLFGISVKNHVFSWTSNKIPEVNNRKNTHFKEVARTLKSSDLKSELLLTKSSSNSSLDEYRFGSLQYESEGSNFPLFLVDKNNKILKIGPSLHGQKFRNLYDGKLIDKNNIWFGPRHKNVDQLKIETVKDVSIYKKFFKTMNKEELSTLQKWWESKSDKQHCETLEVIENCESLKSMLSRNGSNKGGKTIEIKEIIKLKLEQIPDLVDQKERVAPKLEDVIGKNKVIELPKIGSHVATLIGGPIDKWLEDYLKEKNINESNSKEDSGSKEINPFLILEKLSKGEDFYLTCKKLEERNGKENNSNDIKQIYSECSQKINFADPKKQQNYEKEIVLLPSVKEVIKAGERQGDKVKYSKALDSKNGKNNSSSDDWASQGELSEEQAKKIIESWRKSGRSDNLIDLQCQNYWKYLILVTLPLGEAKGCQLVWESIFSGKKYEKRWCLFEIPEAQKYIREYELKFLSTFNWYEGNKFWAKCSNYNI